ncbi:hypothetical protein HHI36_000966 [Cryptolaemus montrouzieri]|uniref:Uncharacterized protein n=1 Tax=Cryptolaemus montrouzieri TaxID=559131 RepID=A0ABD2P7H8_9CUCU
MNLAINKNKNNKSVELAGLKVIMVQKSELQAIYFKASYEEIQKVLVMKRKKDIEVEVKRDYTNKLGLANEKNLIDLVYKKMIPSYYYKDIWSVYGSTSHLSLNLRMCRITFILRLSFNEKLMCD